MINVDCTIEALRIRLRLAWNRDTSSMPTIWTEDERSTGQCAVTALIIQDVLGGRLVRCMVDGVVSHYFNIIDDGDNDEGMTVDLTRDQFEENSHFSDPEPRSREYVLGFAATRQRYELLKARLALQ